MNDESSFLKKTANQKAAPNTRLLKRGTRKLRDFAEQQDKLREALNELAEIRDDSVRKTVQRLQEQLAAIEPSITMIGQVKAGKTSLINAMVGWPGLLPADVNPWTSVVTSLHATPWEPAGDVRARFRFFDSNEWARLLDKGGRIGELAARAGADSEIEKIRAQVEAMREKSRARLGRRFELLMGTQHEYNSFDEDVVERYVCLGDDFADEGEAASTQGRFADVTKSADLYFRRPEFPMPLCIRDTPGVNDTFLMREQITIRSIRDSRLCVVVLSAHQALTSIDMALIRLIANIKSREVVIFVNRIDELSDPARQVEEINASIRETLAAHDGPKDAEILFGSAFWATHALTGDMRALSAENREALLNWAESGLSANCKGAAPLEMIWELSGVPALYDTLSERIVNGVGRESLERIARSTNNLTKGLKAAGHVADDALGQGKLAIDRDDLMARFDRIETDCTALLGKAFDDMLGFYHGRLDRAHQSFVERATTSLVAHLEKYGDKQVWTYDPTGLRLLLRSAHQVFGTRLNRSLNQVYQETAAQLSVLYMNAFGLSEEFRVDPPIPPHMPPPVIIGQTIALDIKGNWWSSWWRRRRGYQAFKSDFFDMIVAETDPIVKDMKDTQTGTVREQVFSVMREFLAEQRLLLQGLADPDGDTDASFGTGVSAERFAAIQATIGTMMDQAA
ncbi:dynamin family protein [Actibacterium sp. XHP0104]|uniref:dynamin family protein n=1 Tax=Actibacterium sp. XHP0104 TaxID=2984335 RepID=UPI0021E81104|nr:dynamin family protein [Actibacterium sp. XHP0104]MCV2882962.1 dynamin family protein [Actibacterium sp. XHP0104]